MTDSLQIAITETRQSKSSTPDRPHENAAVVRCASAWNRAYRKEIKNIPQGKSSYEAKEAAAEAYLAALPHLDGYQNISDFIACVTHALVNEAISPIKVDQFLEAAKVALSLLRHQPKPLGAVKRPVGRPPKSAHPAENN